MVVMTAVALALSTVVVSVVSKVVSRGAHSVDSKVVLMAVLWVE